LGRPPRFWGTFGEEFRSALFEEALKLACVYIAAGRLRRTQRPSDLLLYGALAASGFSMVEKPLVALFGDFSTGVFRSIASAPGHLSYTCVALLLGMRGPGFGNAAKGLLLATAMHALANHIILYGSTAQILLGFPAAIFLDYLILAGIVRELAREKREGAMT
jgi:RsiW-degrading membrane proteinase PrsW (M82 family)